MEEMRKKLSANSTYYNPEMMGESKYGEVRKFPAGTTFSSRRECSDAGVHRPLNAGIAGSKDGAASICISGGYEDDKDEGDFIVYTGTGGQDDSFSATGRQTSDQTFEHKHNFALVVSCEKKIPVRVIRGPNEKSVWAPVQDYRYDGLYHVEKYYKDKGISGYEVCKFELRRLPNQPAIPKKVDG